MKRKERDIIKNEILMYYQSLDAYVETDKSIKKIIDKAICYFNGSEIQTEDFLSKTTANTFLCGLVKFIEFMENIKTHN